MQEQLASYPSTISKISYGVPTASRSKLKLTDLIMSILTLIRHGQARMVAQDYDRLSLLGQ